MQFAFIDESGDVGFKLRSSRWFILTLVVVKNKRQLEKAIIIARKGLRKKQKNVHELHAYHADVHTRKRVLRFLSRIDDLQVFSVVLNKGNISHELQNQKQYL